MKNLEVILSFTCTILGLLITAATFIIKFFSSVKAKRLAEQTIKISNALLPLIREAEKFISFSGAEKKNYDINRAREFASANKISFNIELVSSKIEELVALTKQVNFKQKAE